MSIVTTDVYAAIRQAIIDRSRIICMYHGYPRECCPHAIGWTKGVERVFVYQFDGDSSQGLPIGGQWRCMDICDLTGITIRSGPWHTGTSHLRPQNCVKQIDLDVTMC
jgi:hypothetical protein